MGFTHTSTPSQPRSSSRTSSTASSANGTGTTLTLTLERASKSGPSCRSVGGAGESTDRSPRQRMPIRTGPSWPCVIGVLSSRCAVAGMVNGDDHQMLGDVGASCCQHDAVSSILLERINCTNVTRALSAHKFRWRWALNGNKSAASCGESPRQNFLAEGVGFEPTVGKPTPVFKTGTFVRSVIPPGTTLLERTSSPFCEDGDAKRRPARLYVVGPTSASLQRPRRRR